MAERLQMVSGADFDLQGLLTAKAANPANPATRRTLKADIDGLLIANSANPANSVV